MQYRVTTSSDDAVWNDQDHTDATLTTTITGLTNGQSYDVQVQAINSVGNSDWSTATGTPEPEVPDAPGALELDPGNGELVVTWDVPEKENGAPITGYNVQYRLTSSSGAWTKPNFEGTGTSTTITGLTNGLNYTVQVQAKNSAGNSEWASATGTPAVQPPDPPAKPTVTASDNQLEVSWIIPSTNGADVNGYNVGYRRSTKDNKGSWNDLGFSGKGTSAIIDPLTNGQIYDVRVRATSSAGPGKWSESATGTPGTPGIQVAQKPDAPKAPTLIAGNAQLSVSWIEPSDNGASITDYDVQYRVTTSTSTGNWSQHKPTSNFSSLSTIITGLDNGQSYDVQVQAKNSVDDSDWSPSATGTPEAPAAQVPDAPDLPTLKPGNAQLSVSWIEPSDNGASITDYDVQYQPTSSLNWTKHEFIGAGTSTTITGLTNGLNYTVQVRAENSAGDSEWSLSATGTPALQKPDVPEAPTLIAGNAQLSVSWIAPSNNGASITDYDVQYRVTTISDDAVWNDQDHTDATLTTTITGLTNGQSYDVRVRRGKLGWRQRLVNRSHGHSGGPGSPKA